MKKALFPILLFLSLSLGCVPGSCAPAITTQPPVINSFDAEPPNISGGESSTLSWSVSGANKVVIDPDIGSVALTGRRMVSPSITTTYTLTASNVAGTVTATVRVVVAVEPSPETPVGAPIINYFTASPISITAGASSTLSWSVSNATSVTIAPEIGAVAATGTRTVSPTATTTYTLTAANASSSATARTQVIVSSAPSPLADLVITTGSPTVTPSTVVAGGSVSLSGWTVKNQGAAAAGAFSNGFYLSSDSVITAGDTYLDGNSNPGLAAGAQFNWGGPTLTIPAGTPPGNYYIGILVDRTNAVAESNENNNYVSKSITVSAPSPLADLVITTGSPTVTPSTVVAGGSVSLSGWTVKNQGAAAAGAFSNGFYLSSDSVITAGDTYLGGNSNPGLAAGAQFNWGGPTLTIPAGTPPGNYYIGILVDRTNAVAESNENNNYVSKSITVH